jgi:hypothetical protein
VVRVRLGILAKVAVVAVEAEDIPALDIWAVGRCMVAVAVVAHRLPLHPVQVVRLSMAGRVAREIREVVPQRMGRHLPGVVVVLKMGHRVRGARVGAA